eukprot:CAMPEP_0170518026 /NCGR_PEP_ID=MMETSP0209-20121228/3823_1 /TAXON_ID=665100 ORGANISM="Litonotus pictus, Strain P1" /NCGR_SAMPLE_ID=MMETSP0209 /ASSEMBLY_ACC=CAM_ASM_000301 /LENGTH=180 /DNA_ID=CAMNT_0010803445 /DNA_START=165 /DNA_END=707 /DNA_ORIENTATION=+
MDEKTKELEGVINQAKVDLASTVDTKVKDVELPVGTITFNGGALPEGKWLVCDGRALIRKDFPSLFAVIGATYGAANDQLFNLPDLRGRTAIGSGQGTGLEVRAAGQYIGEEAHTLTVPEMPSHSHPIGVNVYSVGDGIGDSHPLFGANTSKQTTDPVGGGAKHNVIQPSVVVNAFIKIK